jgi:hypothetical protein
MIVEGIDLAESFSRGVSSEIGYTYCVCVWNSSSQSFRMASSAKVGSKGPLIDGLEC